MIWIIKTIDKSSFYWKGKICMLEQKLYMCEFCRTQYKDKQKALDCEKNHYIPKEMRQLQYHASKCSNDGYPNRIEIEFDDGKTIWYKR